MSSRIRVLQSCRVATTTNIVLTRGLQTIDGISLLENDRVLVKNQKKSKRKWDI
tara:strand:- start:515 stop:676 length:162 start_codon:yes stop_codon:yes gene_type:complete